MARANGFVLDEAEFLEGVRCIAAPIRDKTGEIVASIGISAPVNRLTDERCTQAISHVRAVAEEISAGLRGEPSSEALYSALEV